MDTDKGLIMHSRLSHGIAVLCFLSSWSLAFAADFLIEPVNTKFSVLGYANGQFETKSGRGCFKIDSIKFILNETEEAQDQNILGFRLGVGVPYEIDSFDFLSLTKVYPVNRPLQKEKEITLRDIELCLEAPVQTTIDDYFLSMEIHLGHNNPLGYATTYAHEKAKYEKLTSRPIVSAEKFSLSARSGEFNAKTLAQEMPKSTITASLRFIEFNRSNAWPPAAYVGLYQGSINDSSVQFLIIRNQAHDQYAVAGYRIISKGQEVTAKSIEEFPLDASVQVSLQFENGVVTLKANENEPIKIITDFTEASPYVSVSSGSAEFYVSP